MSQLVGTDFDHGRRRDCYLWISWLVICHSAHAAAVIAANNMTVLDVITFYGILGAYSKARSILHTCFSINIDIVLFFCSSDYQTCFCVLTVVVSS